MRTQMRARVEGRFTKFYNLGIWAADSGTVARHSVRAQGDADGFVTVDTLVLDKRAVPDAFQVKVRLFSATPGSVPSLRNLFAATSTRLTKVRPTPGNPALWNRVLPVPSARRWSTPTVAPCGAARPRRRW